MGACVAFTSHTLAHAPPLPQCSSDDVLQLTSGHKGQRMSAVLSPGAPHRMVRSISWEAFLLVSGFVLSHQAFSRQSEFQRYLGLFTNRLQSGIK